MAQKYLSQSSEALLQSVAVAFSYNVTDVLALASLEMAECFRQFDPISTSQYLALHQVRQLMLVLLFSGRMFEAAKTRLYLHSLKIGHGEHT